MPWDSSRVVIRSVDGETEGSTKSIGGDAVAASQPRFSPDGAHLAFVSDADGWPSLWVADADGTNARRARRRTRARRAGMGTRPAFVRVVARQLGAGVVPQREWLRPARDRRAGSTFGARALEGLAPRSRLGRGRDRLCSLRRRDASAGCRAGGQRLGSVGRRPGPGRRVRGERSRRAASRHVEVGQRDRARPAVARGRRTPGGAGRATPPGGRARRADGPGAGRLVGAGPGLRPTGLDRAAARLSGLDAVTGARTRRRSPAIGATATSPTSRPASGTPRRKGGPTPAASPSWAGAPAG